MTSIFLKRKKKTEHVGIFLLEKLRHIVSLKLARLGFFFLFEFVFFMLGFHWFFLFFLILSFKILVSFEWIYIFYYIIK